MAEEILIKVKADTSEFTPSIKAVEQLGTAAEKDVKAFNTLDKAIKEGVNKGIKDAAIQMKAYMDAGGKAASDTGKQFVSLKQKIREARDEASSFADQNSKGAIEAQKNLANLIEQQSDLNQRVAALNPEAKFQAFSQVAQGAIGSLQVLTGTLQAFGVENEEVNKIAQKLQGVLNLSQGINSILGMGDALKNLKVVLGITTVAQTGLATATTAEGAAATEASVANYAFASSLSATGIGAIVVALGALIGAFIAISNSADDATSSVKSFVANSEEADKFFSDILRNSLNADNVRVKNLERQLKFLEETGAAESKVLETKLQLLEAELVIESNIRNGLRNKKEQAEQDQRLYDIVNNRLILQNQLNKAIEKEILASRPKDSPFLPSKEDIQIGLKETADVIAREIPQLSSEIPAIDIPIGITDEDLAQTQSQLQEFADITRGFFDLSNSLSENETEKRIADLEAQRDAGIITNKQYQESVKDLRNEQADATKAQALFEASIGVAIAIINALRTPPAPNFAAGALAATLGALQVATIAAKPVPKFNEGTLSVPGIDQGHDSIFAMLRPKEGVMPVDIMRDYFPVIDAAYNRKIPASVMNNFIRSETKPGRRTNPYDFKYAMDGIGIKVKNTDQLASAIARKIPSSNRIHQKYKI